MNDQYAKMASAKLLWLVMFRGIAYLTRSTLLPLFTLMIDM